jgi:hypothetical protein
MLQGICERGQTLFVPSGWWHCEFRRGKLISFLTNAVPKVVVNLEDSVAVTQNYVSRLELAGVLYFMKHRSEQISGFKFGEGNDDDDDCGDQDKKRGLFAAFCAELRRERPELLREALEDLERLENESGAAEDGRTKSGMSVWDKVVGGDATDAANRTESAADQGDARPFEFGFALDEDEVSVGQVP